MYQDALWTLHKLSNGAAHSEIKLFKEEELQDHITYKARNHIQARIWQAEKGMDDAKRMLPGQ
jgi:hypothetical protein